MEKPVEIELDYTGEEDKVIIFKIKYVHEETDQEIIEKLMQTIEELREKIKVSEERHEQKDKDLSDILFKLEEQAIKYSEDGENYEKLLNRAKAELEKSKKYASGLETDLEIVKAQIPELESHLETKANLCAKLHKALKNREKNRTTAEVILEKQVEMNKDLIEKNVKLEKLLKDSEKKNEEKSRMIKNLKTEIESNGELMNQRDEQIKNVIKKVKVQESEINKNLDDLRKKEEIIKNLQSNLKGNSSPSEVKSASVNQKEYKKAIELVNAKESEIKLMKDMLKSYQLKQHRAQATSTVNKNLKLPPISSSGGKYSHSKEKHIKFSEPSNASKSSLRDPEYKPFHKLRKDTPPPKKTFKGVQLFDKDLDSQNEEIDFVSQGIDESDKSWNQNFEEELKKTPEKRKKHLSNKGRVNEKNVFIDDEAEIGHSERKNAKNAREYYDREAVLETFKVKPSKLKSPVIEKFVKIGKEEMETLEKDEKIGEVEKIRESFKFFDEENEAMEEIKTPPGEFREFKENMSNNTLVEEENAKFPISDGKYRSPTESMPLNEKAISDNLSEIELENVEEIEIDNGKELDTDVVSETNKVHENEKEPLEDLVQNEEVLEISENYSEEF